MRTAAVFLPAFLISAFASGATAPVPKEVSEYLGKVARFAPDRIAALEAGEPIVRTAADDEGEVSVVGAVRIRTTKEHVQLYFDEYIKFEDGVSVFQVGRFSNPPVLADVARLRLEQGDIDALRRCTPGDCDVQIGAGLAELRSAIDWGAPDHGERVNAFVRQRLVDYVKAYREQGDAALVTYDDTSKPVSLARNWRALLASSPYLVGYVPQLERFLEDYPRATLEGGRDFIQWSKVDQGLKRVVALTHIVLYQDPTRPDRLSVALKQLYASHFYEGAFSLATVVDAGTADGHPVSYVVFVNRTRTDILRGALGRMKRRVTTAEIMKVTELTLRQMQQGLEKTAGAR